MERSASTPRRQEQQIVLYDLHVPGMIERLRQARSAWGKSAYVEYLDERHVALVIKPGGARRLLK